MRSFLLGVVKFYFTSFRRDLGGGVELEIRDTTLHRRKGVFFYENRKNSLVD